MAKAALVRVAAAILLLWSGPAAAEDGDELWMSSVKECVVSRMDGFLDTLGNTSCPNSCANCLSQPLQCLSECTNKQAACSCAAAIPQAVESLVGCCSLIWDIFASVCHQAVRGLASTVVDQITNICDASDPLNAPGSLLVKARTAMEEGTVAVVAGLQAGAKPLRGAKSLLDIEPKAPAVAALEEETSTREYVSSHSMGGACLNMMDALESEHAVQGSGEEVPDLLTAAQQIAERASDMLGREMPALRAQVHRAMAVAWSEAGPGMDGHDVCEMILRHHDGL
eukprot:CAMPEP_0204527802 /NCGR_PEP_ID=MMETSP0661-20131031/9178_1 /ASSEMBLY_ACC=CAM_ASM_000606 /TAXON_ID=109239 /ORGANISM="Alexandrium margalefi, Strain AMGDE01CS-322" /LENGTH=282 /DNA_ID=CAMNT_0051533733 /DNA_START=51 /DNA_END=899 /DNA_ORIENTATION=+